LSEHRAALSNLSRPTIGEIRAGGHGYYSIRHTPKDNDRAERH
jgi:hypothetical protein